MHSGDENLVAAVSAIIDDFHGSHRLAGGELASSGLTGTKVSRGLIESHPTNGAGHVRNTLWTNSIAIHHPEENEFFAALRAPGYKLVHKALSHTGFSAPYSIGGASLCNDGDHGAMYLSIILFALAVQNLIPSTQYLNSRPVRCVHSRATTEDEFVDRWAAEGGAWGPPLAGAALHLASANSWSSGLGLSRGTCLPDICKKQHLRPQFA